ncbi:helix-turn-helix domain-containing protein [Paenibacillus tarimensis]
MKALQFIRHRLRLLSFICAAVLIVVLFSLFLSREYANEAMNDVNSITRSKIEHMVQNTQVTLDHLHIYGLSMFRDPIINSWLVSGSNDKLDDSSAFMALRRYQSLQPFISNLFLINNREQRIIDAEYGASSFVDYNRTEILSYRKDIPEKYIHYQTVSVGGRSYVALFIPEPGYNHNVLIVLFDRIRLEQFLFQNNNDMGIAVEVLDRHNRFIMGDAESFEGVRLPTANPMEFIPVKAGETNLQIVSFQLENYGWTLNFALNEAVMTQNIGSFQKKITIACLLLLAILLVIMISGWMMTLRPFRRIAREFQSKIGAGNGKRRQEDAEIIRSGFEYLLDSVRQMDTSLRNYRDIAKEEYLRQWILQGAESQARTALHEIGVLPKLIRPQMAVFRIESYKQFADEYSYRSRKLLKYAMGNIACEIARSDGYAAEAADMDGDHFVLLFADSKNVRDDEADKMLLAVQSNILTYLKISAVVARSGSLSEGASFRNTYEGLYELTLLKFLTGEAKIYTEADMDISIRTDKPFPDDTLVSDLILAVKGADQERMKAVLEQLMSSLRALSFEELHFQLRMVVYTLFKSFSKVIDLEEAAGTDQLLNRFSSLSEVFQWLEKHLLAIMNDQKKRPEGSRKDEIAQEIVDYIENHLQDPSISLDTISDYLGLSSSYIRHVFKDVYEVTLADYLLAQRIEKVKRLLVTTELSIQEIAESAGFLTKSHFYSAFKRSEGMTPLQYRSVDLNREG